MAKKAKVDDGGGQAARPAVGAAALAQGGGSGSGSRALETIQGTVVEIQGMSIPTFEGYWATMKPRGSNGNIFVVSPSDAVGGVLLTGFSTGKLVSVEGELLGGGEGARQGPIPGSTWAIDRATVHNKPGGK